MSEDFGDWTRRPVIPGGRMRRLNRALRIGESLE